MHGELTQLRKENIENKNKALLPAREVLLAIMDTSKTLSCGGVGVGVGEGDSVDSVDPAFLPCKSAFVLMPKDLRVSRNLRAQWFLQHLQKPIRLRRMGGPNEDELPTELEVVGAIPDKEAAGEIPDDWDWDVSHLYTYK